MAAVIHSMTLRAWQSGPRPDKQDMIVQASAIDYSDSWTPHPIGAAAWCHESPSTLYGPHDQPLLVAINEGTDGARRGGQSVTRATIAATLAAAGFANTYGGGTAYFDALPHHRFVASPEGNGVDCHRHMEALLAGCVPIMERNAATQDKYDGLPVLWTTDYSEITREYLERVYADMLDSEYNFSKLFLCTYAPEVQTLVRQRANVWCTRLFGKPYYD